MRLVFLLLLLVALAHGEDDPAALLSSKDVAQRVAGVDAIREKGHADAEGLLLKATEDRDWEVVERAVVALATRGTDASVDALVTLAVRGPVRRIRLAAAHSLKALAPAPAAKKIAKQLKRDQIIPAAEALAILGDPVGIKALQKIVKKKGKKEGPNRIAAIRALGALRQKELIADFTKLLEDRDIGVRAAAVAALVATDDAAVIAILRDGLKAPRMTAVMTRRYISGIRALLLAQEDDKKRTFHAQMIARSFGGAGPVGDARFARLLGALGRHDAPAGPAAEYAKALSNNGTRHTDAHVRSAAVHALGIVRRPDTYDRLADVAKSDTSPRVRFHAMRAAVAIKGDEALPLLVDRLAHDKHKDVREEAAVFLGKRRLKEGATALVAALKDADWEVAVAAAVSIGKLRDARGLATLQAMLDKKNDWRIRGAGVVGLGWIRQADAIPALIGALRDKEPAVAATAREFLRHISGEKLGPNPKPWREWWAKWNGNFTFHDRAAEAKTAKKYGYAVQPRRVYEDLDIIVLQTRKGGDNIQFLLEDYGIEHRIIRAASVNKCGLHPYGLFVANCPGEITSKDAERIQWYVRAGGYLFSSCWALTHTVNKCFPDVVRQLKTRAQVVDTVSAEPVPSESPLIKGVFDATTRPFWELVGSHLIEVIDPERFEVLIDSPETATRWGDGNLAGWFTIGHGLVLDSANHFDMQGMQNARVKTEKDRMAFAVDFLGYDYAELRKLKAEGVFLKQPIAIRKTRDQSIFRFITTFVRQKRLADEE